MVTDLLSAMIRNRLALTPAYCVAGVFVVGQIAHGLPLTPVLLCLAGIVLACGTAIDRNGGDHRHQGYLYTLLGVTVAAVLVIRYTGWSHLEWVAPVLIGAGAALSVPWWLNNKRRTKVILERTVQRWPDLAAKLAMPTVRMVDVRAHPGGNFEARLEWSPGDTTLDEVLSKQGRIEGALDLPVGSLRMPANGRDSNSVNIKAFISDPHERPIEWVPATEVIDGEHYLKIISVLDPIRLGLREDSTAADLILTDRTYGCHAAIIAGAKGSGKSGLLNLLVAHRVCAKDSFTLAIDLKGGMELGPWENAMGLVVTNFNDALILLDALEAIIEVRAEYCASRGIRQWPISPEFPVITLFVDECHSLNGCMKSKQLEVLERIIQKGRALGVEVIEATQYPTLASLGSNLIRQQLDQRFCFRMEDGTGESYLFGSGRGNVVNAQKIPQSRPGTCYHQNADTLDKMPLRVEYVTDEAVDTVVRLRSGQTCPLDSLSGDVLSRFFPGRDTPGQDDDGTGQDTTGHDVPVRQDNDGTTVPGQQDTGGTDVPDIEPWWDKPDVPLRDIVGHHLSRLSPEERDRLSQEQDKMRDTVPGQRLSEDKAKDTVRDMLRNAGEEGVRARDLAKAATRSSSWLYPLLNEWRDAGQVRPTVHGHWAWCGSDRPANCPVTVQRTVQ